MTVLLNHTEQGEGPNLIILHGLFGSSSNWRTIANKLSDEYTVYCLDARNHGDSPWTDSMSYTEMAADVAHFIDHHQIKNATVIGHSMGGKTAMSLALEFPEKLDKLIVADIAPKAYSHGYSHKIFINCMLNLKLDELQTRQQAESFLTAQLNEPKPIIQFLLQNLVLKSQRYQWRINLHSLDHNLVSLMDGISIPQPSRHPSLFLYGKNSDYIRLDDHKLISSVFKNAEIKGVDNAGHWLHAEQPNKFITDVKQFLTASSAKI